MKLLKFFFLLFAAICQFGPVVSESGCICTEQYEPVCGTDWITYNNPCYAKCAGVSIRYKGRCWERKLY